MKRGKFQFGVALTFVLLSPPVAQLVAQPVLPPTREQLQKQQEQLQKQQDAEAKRLREPFMAERSAAAFAAWKYPNAEHGDYSEGNNQYGVMQFKLTSVTTDDIEKVWSYYADQIPTLASKTEPNSKRVPWQSPTPMRFSHRIEGPQQSIHTDIYLPPMPRTMGEVLFQHNGVTMRAVTQSIAPKENQPRKTVIRLLREHSPLKPTSHSTPLREERIEQQG